MLNRIHKLFNSNLISIPNALNKPYIPVLNGFRGVAILIVIISHIILYTSSEKYINGNIGVEIFFCSKRFLNNNLVAQGKTHK